MPDVQLVFFLGKGGVGKSTSSSLFALQKQSEGKKVGLVSLDPAHNLSDIFERRINDKGIEILPNLKVFEVDINYWVAQYLKESESQMKRNYNYLSAYGLQNYFKIASLAPGVEEYGLILAFNHFLAQGVQYDYLIFDMPPTALSLKFFALPEVSLYWIENLLALRNKIQQKKEIISRIKFGKKEIEQDKVLQVLNKQWLFFSQLKAIFQNPHSTNINLVLNTDKLSFSESELIVQGLNRINIKINDLYINKLMPGFDCSTIKQQFKANQYKEQLQADYPLIGMENLKRYILKH